METRSEWMPPIVLNVEEQVREKHGFELVEYLQRLAHLPEAFIVTDEVLCRGVLHALLHYDIRLPRDLKLITKATRHVSLPYYLPVTRVEYDVEELAQKAAGMMRALINGEEPLTKEVILDGTLVRGATT